MNYLLEVDLNRMHHQELLDEAARVRMLRRAMRGGDGDTSPAMPGRRSWFPRLADAKLLANLWRRLSAAPNG